MAVVRLASDGDDSGGSGGGGCGGNSDGDDVFNKLLKGGGL